MNATTGSKIKFPGSGRIYTIISIRRGRKYFNLDMLDHSIKGE
jgi:hypothetical protein